MLGAAAGNAASMANVAYALLLRPPDHVHNPHRLFRIPRSQNYIKYLNLAGEAKSFEVAAFARTTLSLGEGVDAFSVTVECATASYFPVVGVKPSLGRPFAPREDVLGGPRLAVISNDLWTRHFGSDATALGTSVRLGGRDYTLIGIAPPGFRGIELGLVDVWIPLAPSDRICSAMGVPLLASSTGGWLTTIARLRKGADSARARAEVASLLPQDAATSSLAHAPELQSISESGGSATRDGRVSLWLAGASCALLLIACLNVASLFSVRAIKRQSEVAIRLQLGATRPQLLAELSAEHVVLSLLTAGASVLCAFFATRVLAFFFPLAVTGDSLPWRFLLMVMACSGFTTLITGIVPCLEAWKAKPGAGLRTGRGVVPGRSRLRDILMAAQVALALILVLLSGLFMRSLNAVTSNLGFDLDNIVVVSADLRRSQLSRDSDISATFELFLDRVRSLPVVRASAVSSGSLLGSGGSSLVASLSTGAPVAGKPPGIFQAVTAVTPGYFRVLGTRVLYGRAFTDADDALNRPVCIVDQDLGAELWPGESPIRKCVAVGRAPCREVVGVSERRRAGTLTRQSTEFFVPFGQVRQLDAHVLPQLLIVRLSDHRGKSMESVAAAVRGAAPNLPFVRIQPLVDLLDRQTRSWRLGLTVLGSFSAMSLLLAAVGIYSASAFAVRARKGEIGVRIALGAAPGRIRWLVVGESMAPVAIGWACGGVAAFLILPSLHTVLYGVAPLDPAVFVSSSIVLFLSAWLGCLFPSLRAAGVDAATALRAE